MNYENILEFIENRPVVAWFSSRKRTIHRLYKTTARLGDNHWAIFGHNHNENKEVNVLLGSTELHKALSYLTTDNGWTLCEFKSGKYFHLASLAYLGD